MGLDTVGSYPWWKFLLVCLSCALASGPLLGQPLFVKLFANAGVFSSLCDRPGTCKQQLDDIASTFAISGSISMMPAVLGGLAYDRWGGRAVGTAGIVLEIVGVVLLWTCLVGASMGLDAALRPVFVAGVQCCTIGIRMKDSCIWAILWHFPTQQGLIMAASMSAEQTSAFLPLLMEVFMAFFDVGMSVVMFGYCLVLVACACCIWKFTPLPGEFFAAAEAALGIPVPGAPVDFRPWRILRRAWDSIMVYPEQHLAFFVGCAFLGAPWAFYSANTAAYGQALFGTAQAGTLLAEICVIVMGTVGIVLTPLAGLVVDTYGMSAILILAVLCCGLGLALCGLASWLAQVVSIAAFFFAGSTSVIFGGRYWLRYVPPNRYGTVIGLFTTLQVLAFTPLLALGFKRASSAPPGPDAYHDLLSQCCFCQMVITSCFIVYFHGHPPPDLPPILSDDEEPTPALERHVAKTRVA